MKGTAILFKANQSVIIVEDVDRSLFEEIQGKCDCEHCTCKLEDKVVDFGAISSPFWHEDEVDWDYGY